MSNTTSTNPGSTTYQPLDLGNMISKRIILGAACAAALHILSGCTAIAVTTAVVGTAVSVGVTAGSVAVGAATTVAKGAASVVTGGDDDEE